MERPIAQTIMMRIQECVVSGTAHICTGVVLMGYNVYLTAGCVMAIQGLSTDAKMNKMRILLCVLSGTALQD